MAWKEGFSAGTFYCGLQERSTTSEDWYDKLCTSFPNQGLRWTMCRKLLIRTTAQFPTFAWSLLLLSAHYSFQPAGLQQCCLLPCKACVGTFFSICMPQVTILSHSSSCQSMQSAESTSERGTHPEKVFQTCPCQLFPNKSPQDLCFLLGANTAPDNIPVLCPKPKKVLHQHQDTKEEIMKIFFSSSLLGNEVPSYH